MDDSLVTKRGKGAAWSLALGWVLAGTGCLFVDPIDLTPPDPSPWIPEARQAPTPPEAAPPASDPVETAVERTEPEASETRAVPAEVTGIFDVSMPLATDIPGARPITLAEVLATVGSEALDIRLAQEDASSSEAARRVVRDSLLPSFSFQTKFGLLNGATQGSAGRIFDANYQNTAIGPEAALVYDLDSALFTLKAAEEQLAADVHGIATNAHNSLRDAATGYFDLVESCAQLWIGESSVRHARELVDLEKTRVDSGAGLEVDLLRAQAQLSEAERAVLEARRSVAVASAKLVQLLGLAPTTELVPAERVVAAVDLIPLEDLESLVNRAESNRPEIGTANRQLAATTENEKYWENRWLIPQVKLSAEYGGFGSNPRDLSDRELYTAGAEWSLDPTNLSQLDKARAARRKAELTATQSTRLVASETVQAYRSAQAASATILSAVREVQANTEAYELAKARYQEGAAVQEEVLRAELALTTARGALASALASYDRYQFELARAIGGPGRR